MVCADCGYIKLIQQDLDCVKSLVRLIARHFHLVDCDCSECHSRSQNRNEESPVSIRESLDNLKSGSQPQQSTSVVINEINSSSDSDHPRIKTEVIVQPIEEQTTNDWADMTGYESYRLPLLSQSGKFDFDKLFTTASSDLVPDMSALSQKLYLQSSNMVTPPSIQFTSALNNGNTQPADQSQMSSASTSNHSWSDRPAVQSGKKKRSSNDSTMINDSNGMERQFGCEFCGKIFIQRGHLEEHTRIHSGGQRY